MFVCNSHTAVCPDKRLDIKLRSSAAIAAAQLDVSGKADFSFVLTGQRE